MPMEDLVGTTKTRLAGAARAPRAKGTDAAAGSLAEGVYRELLQAINDGRFRPGDRVMETAVADWLDVSRTPVREALRRLESEDVLVKGNQGLVVVDIAESELLELYDLRETLEGMAAELAARNATDADRKLLARLIADEARCSPGDAAGQATINREFHRALASAAHNRFLCKMLNGLQDAFLRLRSTIFSLPDRPPLALDEHRAIVRAITDGDAVAAARAARHHIRQSRRSRLRLHRLDERQGLRPGSTLRNDTAPKIRRSTAALAAEPVRPHRSRERRS